MKRFPFSLRYSIPLILVFFGSLLGIFSFWQEIKRINQETENNAKNYLQLSSGQTAIILNYLYRRKDTENLVITIISQLGSDPNLSSIMLLNEQNIVQVSSHYELINSRAEDTIAKNYLSSFKETRDKLKAQILVSENKQRLIAIYPILLQVLPDEIQPSRIGILLIEYDLTVARKQAYNQALQKTLISNGFLALFCLGLWFFFELTLTRRVSQLVSASHSLAQGNLDIRTKLSGSDELAKISIAFDSMASKIQQNTLILEQELIERKAIAEKLKETNIELQLATQAKSQFLANMSHEIRTPMNGVIGIAELLALTNLDDEQKDFIQVIQDSGKTLLTIINDILDFSRSESGKLQLDQQNFRFINLVKSVCFLLSKQAEKKEINLEYFIDSQIPSQIIGDSSRLRQIFLNLIGNAIKFTETGNIFISVQINNQVIIDEQIQLSEYELLVTIQDSGIGIDSDRIDQLFQPFTQADASINRKYGGTGLGLAISKSLIELMGGTIWVESLGKLGGNPPDNWQLKSAKSHIQGSIFYFTFKAKEVLACDLITRDSSPQISLKSTEIEPSQCKILLAEDNIVNQKVALLTLKKLGYKADVANNGLEVLKMLEKQFYDVILMDMQMPEMDGLTTTKIIRQSLQSQPYIIALTANVLEEDRQQCFSVGMNDYIGKPIIISELKTSFLKYSNLTK